MDHRVYLYNVNFNTGLAKAYYAHATISHNCKTPMIGLPLRIHFSSSFHVSRNWCEPAELEQSSAYGLLYLSYHKKLTSCHARRWQSTYQPHHPGVNEKYGLPGNSQYTFFQALATVLEMSRVSRGPDRYTTTPFHITIAANLPQVNIISTAFCIFARGFVRGYDFKNYFWPTKVK